MIFVVDTHYIIFDILSVNIFCLTRIIRAVCVISLSEILILVNAGRRLNFSKSAH